MMYHRVIVTTVNILKSCVNLQHCEFNDVDIKISIENRRTTVRWLKVLSRHDRQRHDYTTAENISGYACRVH